MNTVKKVQKSNGSYQPMEFDKITKRIQTQEFGLKVCSITVAQKTIQGLYDNVKTSEIDDLISETAANMVTTHPDYSILAARIKATRLHKQTQGFKHVTDELHKAGMLNYAYWYYASCNNEALTEIIDYDRDLNFDYFGLCTLLKSYLLKIDNKIIERPQDLWMRCAITVNLPEGLPTSPSDSIPSMDSTLSLKGVKETYDALSKGYYTHATPTLFNSGTKNQQLSSCFLMAMKDDSIDGIFDTVKDAARISKTAGGIGIHASNIRSNGSLIQSTGGKSNGLIPFLKVFNETARTVDQGGGKRKGSIAIYLEPWHADIEQFLELRKNTGAEEFRARDLFLSLWVNDLFMERVEKDLDWTLMCPKDSPGLSDVYGTEFEKLYTQYESENRGKKTIKARDLMSKIIESQIESGQPYMLYKDTINKHSNQKNIGTIKSSNLCAEIVEYSDKNETAVCNLASIALPKFVKNDYVDYGLLYKITKLAVKNLNRIIDINQYPTPESENSNKKHRPIGLGVQGLADLFFKLGIPYDSEEAKIRNKEIFQIIYYAAMESSWELAQENGPYEKFTGSPLSYGKFQFDSYKAETHELINWDELRLNIIKDGVRNSLTTACMPTASTSNILGNTEAFQIQTSNIYKRQTLSGEFMIINKHLVEDLEELNLWNDNIRDQIILNNGSVQNLDIPQHLKDVYKTTWETSQRVVIDMAADRQPFIDQSQSMNLWLEKPTFGKVLAMHQYAWKKGLKTGMYYLRSRSAVDAVKMTVSDSTETEECTTCSA